MSRAQEEAEEQGLETEVEAGPNLMIRGCRKTVEGRRICWRGRFRLASWQEREEEAEEPGRIERLLLIGSERQGCWCERISLLLRLEVELGNVVQEEGTGRVVGMEKANEHEGMERLAGQHHRRVEMAVGRGEDHVCPMRFLLCSVEKDWPGVERQHRVEVVEALSICVHSRRLHWPCSVRGMS